MEPQPSTPDSGALKQSVYFWGAFVTGMPQRQANNPELFKNHATWPSCLGLLRSKWMKRPQDVNDGGLNDIGDLKPAGLRRRRFVEVLLLGGS